MTITYLPENKQNSQIVNDFTVQDLDISFTEKAMNALLHASKEEKSDLIRVRC